MATRLYLSSSNAPGVSPAYSGTWTTVPGGAQRRTASTTQDSSALALTGNITEAATTGTEDVLMRQFVSTNSFQYAKTISGTFSYVIYGYESNGAANAFIQVMIKVVSSDGATVRGTLYAGHTDVAQTATVGARNEELPVGSGSAATRIGSALSLSSVGVQAGDLLVIEVGARFLTSSSSTFSTNYRFGSPNDATADHALTSGLTTTLVPWVEFSDTLFDAPASSSDPTAWWGVQI